MKKAYRRRHFLKPYFEDKLHSFTIANRFRFYLKQIPYIFSVNIGIWLPAGSVCDPRNKEGIAHLTEHLIFKGTKKRSDREIFSAIESKGGKINAATSEELTYIQVTALPEYIPEALDIIADILNNAAFDIDNIEKEKKIVLEEIALLEDTPEELVADLFNYFVWDGNPLGKPILGTENSVNNITRSDLLRFYKKWYTSGEIIIVVVGNIDEKQLLKEAEKYFGKYGVYKPTSKKKICTPKFNSGIKCYLKDITQVHFSLGFPAPGTIDNQKYQYVPFVAVNILAGGSNSKLFYRIREQEGLAYNIYSNYEQFGKVGYIQVGGSVSSDNFLLLLDLATQELKNLKDKLLPDDVLEKYKEEIMGDWLLNQEFASSHLTRIGNSIFYTDEVLSVEEYLNALKKIKPVDVCEFFQQFCTPDKFALVYISPKEYNANDVINI